MSKNIIVVHICAMECFSAIEINELLIHSKQINIKIIMVHEKNPGKKRVHIVESNLGNIPEKTNL